MGGEKTVVREVSKGESVRLARVQARSESRRHAAVLRKAREEQRAISRRERFAAKIELAKIRAGQSASEKARTNIALTSPALLMVLIGGFIIALSTGAIPEDAIATASALLTMLSAGLLQNLRSIISESNGHDGEPPGPKPGKDAKTSGK